MIQFLIQSLPSTDADIIKALMQVFLQSMGSSDIEIVKAWGPVIVGCIGILASFVLSAFLLWIQRSQNRSLNEANARQFALLKSKEERDEIIKKLNTFYGPFKQMRTQSRILYEKFVLELSPQHQKTATTRFRTLRYILEGKPLTDQEREILIQILDISRKTLQLIEAHSGLVDKPELQELLGKLGAHIRILQLAYDGKLTGPPSAFEDIVFPSAIDGAIESAILRLQDRLKELVEFEGLGTVSKQTEKPENSTITYYNLNAEAYNNKTLFLDLSDFYSRFRARARLSIGSRILDAGCGVGRDVRYFIEQGFIVIAFDASREMVRKCLEYPHAYCIQLSFADVQFREEFDAVWACASLLHLTRSDARAAMSRLTTALKPGGVMFVSVKVGAGSQKDNGRHFEYYDDNSVKELYEHDSRLEFDEMWKSPPNSLEGNGTEWLNVILRRRLHSFSSQRSGSP